VIRLSIVAVGRLKEQHWRAAADEYAKRLRPYAAVKVAEVQDRDISRGTAQAMAAEADDILRALPKDAYIVALDEGGTERRSTELASWLDDLAVRGVSHVAFVVGGSAGLDGRIADLARERFALSRMTLPHQLARVVLLEQLYRAFRISRGEPYHL
jgi:23S rRNA (pseudouridine1915-N3)-methyltransferase